MITRSKDKRNKQYQYGDIIQHLKTGHNNLVTETNEERAD
jgi:hypothetical protein